MWFVETLKILRLIARLRGREKSINVRGTGKRKFVAQFHVDPNSKAANSSDTEN